MAMANGQDDSNNTEILIIHANLLNITNTFRQKSFETVCKIEKKCCLIYENFCNDKYRNHSSGRSLYYQYYNNKTRIRITVAMIMNVTLTLMRLWTVMVI